MEKRLRAKWAQKLGQCKFNEMRATKEEIYKNASSSLYKMNHVINNIETFSQIQIIDFFSGAGGTSLGFAALNEIYPIFRFLGGVDIDELSAQTYSKNFKTKKLCLDIRDIAKSKISIDSFLNEIGYCSDLPTILIGCPPCQGFSSHRKKHWDEEDDKRNDLVADLGKIIRHVKPMAFLMENVPEFLSKRYWHYLSNTCNEIEKDGYVIKKSIYNSAGFGVPQERFRSIVIGMQKEFILPDEFLAETEYKTVSDAIGKLRPLSAGESDPDDPLYRCVAHKKNTIEVIKQVPHNGGNRPAGVGPKCLDKVKGFSDVYGRLYWDRPAITITHYARNPASGRFVHPEQDRGLTAREAALLQSFPNSFKFEGKSDDIYRQIGEAVPPLLSCGILVCILSELIDDEPTKEELAVSRESISEPVNSSYSSVIAGIKIARKRK